MQLAPLPLAARPADRFGAGASMGGFWPGACTQPDEFIATLLTAGVYFQLLLWSRQIERIF